MSNICPHCGANMKGMQTNHYCEACKERVVQPLDSTKDDKIKELKEQLINCECALGSYKERIEGLEQELKKKNTVLTEMNDIFELTRNDLHDSMEKVKELEDVIERNIDRVHNTLGMSSPNHEPHLLTGGISLLIIRKRELEADNNELGSLLVDKQKEIEDNPWKKMCEELNKWRRLEGFDIQNEKAFFWMSRESFKIGELKTKYLPSESEEKERCGTCSDFVKCKDLIHTLEVDSPCDFDPSRWKPVEKKKVICGETNPYYKGIICTLDKGHDNNHKDMRWSNALYEWSIEKKGLEELDVVLSRHLELNSLCCSCVNLFHSCSRPGVEQCEDYKANKIVVEKGVEEMQSTDKSEDQSRNGVSTMQPDDSVRGG